MRDLSDKRGMTAEEYFSTEDFEWLTAVADYDRGNPERLVFADGTGGAVFSWTASPCPPGSSARSSTASPRRFRSISA